MLNFYQAGEHSAFVNSMSLYLLKNKLKRLKPRIKRRNNSYHPDSMLFSSAIPTADENIEKEIIQR